MLCDSHSQPCSTHTTHPPSCFTTRMTSSLARLAALTPDERRLLMDNDGCLKCQQFFAGHQANACPNGFPDASLYKTLTADEVSCQHNRAMGSTAPRTKAVALVEEVTNVGVVMPSTVLGDSTDSEPECVAPLSVPHLTWPCLLSGPATSSPSV